MPEKARKHLEVLVELRDQLASIKAQADAVIESVEAHLQRDLPEHVRPLTKDQKPRKRR